MSGRPSSKTPKSSSKTPKPKSNDDERGREPKSKTSVRVPPSAVEFKNFKALRKMSPIGEEDNALDDEDDDGFEQFRGVSHRSKLLVKSSDSGSGSKMPASGDTFANNDQLKKSKGKGKAQENEAEEEETPELDFELDDLEFGFGCGFAPGPLSGKPTSVMPHSDAFRDTPLQPQLQQSSAMPRSDASADPKKKKKSDPKKKKKTHHIIETELPTPGDFKPKSILKTKEDRFRAQLQPHFSELEPSFAEIQKSWAMRLIKRSGACPEQREWIRMDASADGQSEGGFLCAGGRHGVLDSMIELGTGGIFCLLSNSNGGDGGGSSSSSSSIEWATATKFGPYFRDPGIRNVWVEIELPQRLTLPGLHFCARKVLFLGSENQVARAKWEFFDMYPGLQEYYRYVMPKREPPEEWSTDKKNLIKW
ncbi:uncharacterized protein L3040_005953 [Drepanopeziza brunnea f. sp. 'multigermtubi']|uniref:Uncharacterized protein n=1 Tax=Marssonina brunnea f. sp. multigermtubi (strain MB_m1) TaxID=1072389 RepID=K1XCU8_MARBU|nr:uncharacterized protein MBM_03581 [Drepanopeziza brunnea f. sp. 'multigermtubi' MB_m1]EKD18588.1 hypothetical protein MBM_03581 [Drepanopeziza brunnea f. sp. 'multigermtubi' MB_m1]KAJ5040295.1 hypothetical protein L3040_005953 [Drepanopeziza brunnea f. sp. 'multigermtubi']